MNSELSCLMSNLSATEKKLSEMRNAVADKERDLILEVTNKMIEEKITAFEYFISVIDDSKGIMIESESVFRWDGQKWYHRSYDNRPNFDDFEEAQCGFENEDGKEKPLLSETILNRAFFVRQLPNILAAGNKEKEAQLNELNSRL